MCNCTCHHCRNCCYETGEYPEISIFDWVTCEVCCIDHDPDWWDYISLKTIDGDVDLCSAACVITFLQSEEGEKRLRYTRIDEYLVMYGEGGVCDRDGCRHHYTLESNGVAPTAKIDWYREVEPDVHTIGFYGGYGPADDGLVFCSVDCAVRYFETVEAGWDVKRALANKAT